MESLHRTCPRSLRVCAHACPGSFLGGQLSWDSGRDTGRKRHSRGFCALRRLGESNLEMQSQAPWIPWGLWVQVQETGMQGSGFSLQARGPQRRVHPAAQPVWCSPKPSEGPPVTATPSDGVHEGLKRPGPRPQSWRPPQRAFPGQPPVAQRYTDTATAPETQDRTVRGPR